MKAWWWLFFEDEIGGAPPPTPRALGDTAVVAVGRLRSADAQVGSRSVRSFGRSAEEA